MARIFYTERDIEDLAKRGVQEIEVNDCVYITDLAREKMDLLGVKAKIALAPKPATLPPKPAAPTPAAPSSPSPLPRADGKLTDGEKAQVIEKVRAGVIARLGPGVDTALVDTIVRRVVGQL